MAWDRTRAGREVGSTMRTAKSCSSHPWACSSFASSDKFLPLFDNMLESWADRDAEKYESPVFAGCEGQAPRRSSLLSRTQKFDSDIVLPQSIVSRWSVHGKKLYCRTSVYTSVKWQQTHSSQRTRMSVMFLDYYKQTSGKCLPDAVQNSSGYILSNGMQTGAMPLDFVRLQNPDPSSAKDQCRGLVLSIAGAAGMRLICPPRKLPILEMVLFSFQQLASKNRARFLEEQRLWRFPLNLALATFRPFCGSLVRRCLTVLLCMSQMRSRKSLPDVALRSIPDLYSIVQMETECLAQSQFTVCCKHIQEDHSNMQSGDNPETVTWNDSTARERTGENHGEGCSKCGLVRAPARGNIHSDRNRESRCSENFGTFNVDLEVDDENRDWPNLPVENFTFRPRKNDRDSLKRLRMTDNGLKPSKRHCIPVFESRTGSGFPSTSAQCNSMTADGETDSDETFEVTFPMCPDHPKSSGIECVRDSDIFSNCACASNDSCCLSQGSHPECRIVTSRCDRTGPENEFDGSSKDHTRGRNVKVRAEANSALTDDRNNRHRSANFYRSESSLPERRENSDGDDCASQPPFSLTLHDSVTNSTRSQENFELNLVSSSHDSSRKRTLNRSLIYSQDYRLESERGSSTVAGLKNQPETAEAELSKVQLCPENFESETASVCNGNGDYKQNDSFLREQHGNSSALEAHLCRYSSSIRETYPDDSFADHPTCIYHRQRRHTHGDQIYLDMKDLLPPPWGQLIFWHGRCKEGRPTLYVLLGRAVRELRSQELKQFIAVTVSHVEYAELNFFKGPVKRMNILIDLEGLGFMRLPPLNILSSIGTVLNRDYPGRGGWIMLINSPALLGLVVGTIQGIIFRHASNKGAAIDSSFRGFLEGRELVLMIGSKYRQVLQKHIEANMLPFVLGGDCTCKSDGAACKHGIESLSYIATSHQQAMAT